MSVQTLDVPAGFSLPSGAWGAAIVNGAPTITFPLESEGSYARLYSQPFLVHSGADTPGATGAPGIFPNTFLVAEGERFPLGGGFYEFSAQFAEIPSGFNTFETITYTYPALNTVRPLQKTETVVARVWNDFHLTASPQSVTRSGAQRFVNVYGWDITELNYGAATVPSVTTYSGWVGAGTEFIAEQATIDRHIGPIWRRSTPYVKAL